jgi:hypothetical protein
MTHEEYDALEEIVGGSYNRGYADGLKTGHEGGYRSSYEKGLEDAWECAKKVVLQYVEGGFKIDVFKKIFGESTYQSVLKKYTASETMQKIKEYEERQKDDEKSCGTCKHVMRIDCGAYPCNECPRDTLPKWTPKQDEKCEKCTKEISAECVVDGCEFEAKQNEKLCDRCKKSKLCELSYLKYVNTCSDFCPKTDATDIDDGIIKVGDEVYLLDKNYKTIVTRIYEEFPSSVLKAVQFTQRGQFTVNCIEDLHKTGRHFPQIAEVLEQLRGEE